jgi:hypothetical protein
VLAQPAWAKKQHPLPDLRLSKVTHEAWVFQNDPGNVGRAVFCERTSNLGRGATSRVLHNRMYLVGPSGGQLIATRDVPKLAGVKHFQDKHGRSHRRVESHGGCGHLAGPVNLPLGAYGVEICADEKVKQVHVSDNCKVCSHCFFVIRKSWTGTVSGENALDPSLGAMGKFSWQAAAVTFTFARQRPNIGVFEYTVSGSVNYQFAGSDDEGCSGAGGGTFSISGGKLNVDYVGSQYDLYADVPAGSTVPVTFTCPDSSVHTIAYPVINRFLNNGQEKSIATPLTFGQDVLGGTYQTSYPGVTTYQDTWSLR